MHSIQREHTHGDAHRTFAIGFRRGWKDGEEDLAALAQWRRKVGFEAIVRRASAEDVKTLKDAGCDRSVA